MRVMPFAIGVLPFIALFAACGSTTPTGPASQSTDTRPEGGSATVSTRSAAIKLDRPQPISRQVSMMDACDGPTFNLVVGPGTCSRPQGVNFSEFIAQLTAHQSAGAWHNAPPQTDAWLGDTVLAVNKGGEVHTFTRVAAFGGGVVGLLNQLAGTPNVVPECNAERTFVPPGGTDTESLDQTGELKFQCCIHPWMHTTILVKSH
jgi:plastocyanin